MKITVGRNDTPPPREVPDTPKFAGDKTTLIKLMATTKRPTFVNAYTAPMSERRGGCKQYNSIIWYGGGGVGGVLYACLRAEFSKSFPGAVPSQTPPPPPVSMPMADCTDIHDFTDFVFINYINTDSAMFFQKFSPLISRITNDCESLHSKFNDKFYHSHLNINQLTQNLNEVQAGSYMKMNCSCTKFKVSKRYCQKGDIHPQPNYTIFKLQVQKLVKLID